MRGLWVAVAACVGGGSVALAAEPAQPARRVVAELFTSEGCSSCPPADALLSELARTRPDVLPLAFHVTYWDRLGWPDPFAFEGATARQRGYAAMLGLGSIYTPQLVVDGTRDVIGSDRPAVLRALAGARAGTPEQVSLTLSRTAGGITAAIGTGRPEARATLLLAGYDSAHRTTVAHGENAGRTLTESNIVRELVRAGDWHGAAATLRATVPAGEHVAAILQARDGQILATAVLD
jgi:hypothetical protein